MNKVVYDNNANGVKAMNALKSKKLFMLDMDGTLYIGDALIGEMDKTLDVLRTNGKKIIYLTNNSSKSKNSNKTITK